METSERVEKLPKWVQEHIRKLKNERDQAVQQLEKIEAQQQETKVWTDELVNDGKTSIRRRYFNADQLTIKNGGVMLTISGLYDEKEGIRLSWRPADKGHKVGNIFFIPKAYQQAQLLAP